MFNIFMLVISILFVGVNFVRASSISETKGNLLNLDGMVSVVLIGLWSYLMGYYAVTMLGLL